MEPDFRDGVSDHWCQRGVIARELCGSHEGNRGPQAYGEVGDFGIVGGDDYLVKESAREAGVD
jgi:hypothetical protein